MRLTLRRHQLAICLFGAWLLAGCSKAPDSPAATAEPAPATASAPAATAATADATALSPDASAGIAWVHAATDAEVDAAFAQARSLGKPLMLYWGASWCPPCNQLKATLFNRADFIARTRAFVAVDIDGDRPGAQKLGSRFRVNGYPTTVLFDSQGVEITRLPGEVDPALYTDLLGVGMTAGRPVKDLVAAARSGGAGLTASDWTLLAFYSWDTDQAQWLRKDELPAVLAQLARACPPEHADAATRLWLKSLSADRPKGSAPDRSAPPRLLALLNDAARARRHVDSLSYGATAIVRAASAKASADRRALLPAFDAALQRLQQDTTLSRGDRLTALMARMDLARIDAPDADDTASKRGPPPALPAALVAEVRAEAARLDADITDGHERQAVIPAAAWALTDAGLSAESDALLQANLAKSHSPYYLMSALAENAQQRGDTAAALRWRAQAFEASTGNATRLQWGARYVAALLELAPKDEARIEKAVGQVWALAAEQPDAFHERSKSSLKRLGARLQKWNAGGAHRAAFARLQAGLGTVCSRLGAEPAQQSACNALLAADTRATPG
jgi:thiol-disulfide isomerase/thioredoxin